LQWVEVGGTLSPVANREQSNLEKQKPQNKNNYMAAIDSFERRLDDKNRLTIPAELRAELDEGQIVLTRGFGRYIHMYAADVWDEEVEPALQGAILDERVADLNVRFRRGKSTAQLDIKQGRVTIDQSLLEYAGIDREIIAVRAGKYWRMMSPAEAETS